MKMSFQQLKKSILSIGFASLLVFSSGYAGADTTAKDYLKGKHDTVNDLLKGKDKDKDSKISSELKVLLDFDDMSKKALGDEWDNRSESEQKEFTDLLKKLFEKNYKKRIHKSSEYDVKYLEEEKDSESGFITVSTEVKKLKDKRATPVSVKYKLRKSGTTYLVVDVITEDSSMVRTHHREFKKILKKDGFEAVIKKMKEQLAKS